MKALFKKITLPFFFVLFLSSCYKREVKVSVINDIMLSAGHDTPTVVLSCGKKTFSNAKIYKSRTYYSLGEIKEGTYDLVVTGQLLDYVAFNPDGSFAGKSHLVSKKKVIEVKNNIDFEFDFSQ